MTELVPLGDMLGGSLVAAAVLALSGWGKAALWRRIQRRSRAAKGAGERHKAPRPRDGR